MFNATNNQGFTMQFENGWTVSVQWGTGNYCANRTKQINGEWWQPAPASNTAEIAAWDADGNDFEFDHDAVAGWCTPEEVAAFLAMVAIGKPELWTRGMVK
jgi:hypothetical protein